MAQILVSTNLVIPNGPQLGFQQTLDVDAYDKIDVTVSPDSTTPTNPLAVQLQPGTAGQVKLVAIVSDWYGDNLTYRINQSSAPPQRKLDQPHLLTGAGAVSFFYDPAHSADPPSELFFNNAGSNPAFVQILIGRDATP